MPRLDSSEGYYILNPDNIVDKLKVFFTEHGDEFKVQYAILFGSYAKGENNPLSDVDIAVKIANRDKLVELAYELEGILGTNFDLVDIDTLDPIMLYEVYSSGLLLYCKEPSKYYDDYIVAISKFLDFQYVFRQYQEAILHGYSRTDKENS